MDFQTAFGEKKRKKKDLKTKYEGLKKKKRKVKSKKKYHGGEFKKN